MIYDFIVIKNGLPLLSINLDPKRGICQDENKFTLVSGFFQAITSFADSVSNFGEVNEIQMTDILFSFQRIKSNEDEDLLLFIISSDLETPKTIRKIIIQEASSTFLHMFKKKLEKSWNGDVKFFNKFKPIFNNILNEIFLAKTDRNLEIKEKSIKKVNKFNPKSKNSTNISKRFQRYKTLTTFQQEIQSKPNKNKLKTNLPTTSGLLNSFNLNLNTKPLSNKSVEAINTQDFYFAPPVPQRSFLKQNEYSFYITPNSRFSNNTSHSGQSQQFRGSVFDLIPIKNNLTAGMFQNKISDSWMRMLIVTLDGRKSIKTLAKMLNSTPTKVLNACQTFAEMNFIRFKK